MMVDLVRKRLRKFKENSHARLMNALTSLKSGNFGSNFQPKLFWFMDSAKNKSSLARKRGLTRQNGRAPHNARWWGFFKQNWLK